MKRYSILYLFLLILALSVKGQSFQLEKLQDGRDVSFRGMAVLNDSIAWISGTKGTVVRTVDGGETWQWLTVEGYEDYDFRSISAFSEKKAIIVNAGSPAIILLTENGGDSWKKVYSYDIKEIFYDGIGFWDDKTGLVFGDPIAGKLQLLLTEDGGENWLNISDQANVEMQEGEAGFAASGTSILTAGDGLVWIGTGGKQARVLFSYNYGQAWTSYKVPIEQGEPTQGIFSLAVNEQKQLIAVGGDYKNFRNNNNVIQLSSNGATWVAPKTRISGYKSCVSYLSDSHAIATGTSGTDISTDAGQTWKLLSEQGFNVAKAAKNGKLVLLAGDKGTIYRLNQE